MQMRTAAAAGAVPQLAEALGHPDHIVRQSAAQALGAIGLSGTAP
jgi:HEAT repeat protein